MTVSGSQIIRLTQRVLIPYECAQYAVDQSRRRTIGVALGLLHRLIDRRRYGHPVTEQDLIRAEAQNIQHDRLELFELAFHLLRQIIIQQHPILQHAVTQPRSKSRVAAVERVARDIFL